eukprot:TRINITY_DN2862_c0_g1_i1.p1 TRINITY_DN2862_c0_g1~~TRINITY_DN2862_c0_g1_i1.p1  ORF type:complete len:487 (-),score=191.88 TRINITY_DN2862_c0_g1_i1:33-1493(-)
MSESIEKDDEINRSRSMSLSEQMELQKSKLKTLEKQPTKSESGDLSGDRPNVLEMKRAAELQNRSSSFRFEKKRNQPSPLLRTLPAPGTPRSTRRGAVAPVPHSPALNSGPLTSTQVKELLEKSHGNGSFSSNGTHNSHSDGRPVPSSLGQQNAEKIKSLEQRIKSLEEKLNETLITHHDQAEIQNRVILRLQKSKKKTRKKMKSMQKQLKTISKNMDLSAKDLESFDQESLASYSSFATGMSSNPRNSVGGMPNLHLFSMGEMIKTMNQNLDKQKEMMDLQQKEMNEMKRRLEKAEAKVRKNSMSNSGNAIGYPSIQKIRMDSSDEIVGNMEENNQEEDVESDDQTSGQYLSPSEFSKVSSSEKQKALAIFDFLATRSGDLSFSEGELIIILKKYGDGWWLGKSVKSGSLGRFPSNYIEELKDDPFMTIAVEGFKGEEEGDLTFEAGDAIVVLKRTEEPEGWWFGELDKDGTTGWLPSTYVVQVA